MPVVDASLPPATSRTRVGYPPSPCINVCTLDDDQVCVGCRRTLDEIGAWAGMSADEQHAVIARLGERR